LLSGSSQVLSQIRQKVGAKRLITCQREIRLARVFSAISLLQVVYNFTEYKIMLSQIVPTSAKSKDLKLNDDSSLTILIRYLESCATIGTSISS
jgi:hypothetical protein